VLRRVAGPGAARVEVQAVPRADPEPPRPVLVERPDAVGVEPIGLSEDRPASVGEAVQAPSESADPEGARRILQDRADVVVGEPLDGARQEEAPGPQALEPAGGADPEASFAVLVERAHAVARQPVLLAECREASAREAHEPAPDGAEPDGAVAVAGK